MKKILFILAFIITVGQVCAYTEYKVGDEVTYNEIKYYVIKDSSTKESSVTMLKAEPLTVSEINEYGTGHVNRYTLNFAGTAYDSNGYGGMAYYSSSSCGYIESDGCTTSYASSEIKYAVDAWKAAKAPAATEARLITKNELIDNLGYVLKENATSEEYIPSGSTPSWVYNSNYRYWTMSPYTDSASHVWGVGYDGGLGYPGVGSSGDVVRPVITLSKTALGAEDEIVIDDDTNKEDDIINKVDSNDTKGFNTADNETSDIKSTVKVANTYMRNSIITIIIGFIIASASIFILYKLRNKAK